MTKYIYKGHMGDGIAKVKSSYYGDELFSRRKLRKDAKCADCGSMIAKGEIAYGPFSGNGMNRMHRIHPSCLFGNRKEHDDAG